MRNAHMSSARSMRADVDVERAIEQVRYMYALSRPRSGTEGTWSIEYI
jgi:hypothetical protein